jgi:hypothetical protein
VEAQGYRCRAEQFTDSEQLTLFSAEEWVAITLPSSPALPVTDVNSAAVLDKNSEAFTGVAASLTTTQSEDSTLAPRLSITTTAHCTLKLEADEPPGRSVTAALASDWVWTTSMLLAPPLALLDGE